MIRNQNGSQMFDVGHLKMSKWYEHQNDLNVKLLDVDIQKMNIEGYECQMSNYLTFDIQMVMNAKYI